MKQLEWILPQTPASEDDLSSVSTSIRQSLPNDFRAWLLKHNGAAPEPSELSLEGGRVLVINCFVSFSSDDSSNVVSILEMLRGRLPNGLIPIAEDHGGNYVCFRYNSTTSSPDVVLWLHEEADPKHAIVPIASSFTELIKLLEKGVS
jgi:cell wall assembly regulator SMI1